VIGADQLVALDSVGFRRKTVDEQDAYVVVAALAVGAIAWR
jgi:hypothetical protein